MMLEESRRRIVIENLSPSVYDGSYPVKSVVGRSLTVEADVFTNGHDRLSAQLLHRIKGKNCDWQVEKMEPTGNDRWRGSFTPRKLGRHEYTVKSWVDLFATWRQDLSKKYEAGFDVSVQLQVGRELIRRARANAPSSAGDRLAEFESGLTSHSPLEDRVDLALSEELETLMSKFGPSESETTAEVVQDLVVDRKKAQFSTWYEMFPRSCIPGSTDHGTFEDCKNVLPDIAEMGFDVLYFPPIHPIGRTNRKGKNNTLASSPEDPGSPWAIGSEEGGHKSVHPKLGTIQDFRELVEEAKEHGLEIALDLAFQCSPDHPYVKDHPEWFHHRPDGSIQYAENPPKKYEDIYPLNFTSDDWKSLWEELREVVYFWIDQGIRIFRVDNPHTKPLNFWEWLINTVKREYPEVIFLSEAFTRPKVMYYLAKIGFSQSYTYFAWRNTKNELKDYFRELNSEGVRDYFRPNLWPNTPDILTEYLQTGGRAAFVIRLILAATLGANYGVYGPPFELMESTPRKSGSEEYMNSEKYQIRKWNLEEKADIRGVIRRVNNIRSKHSALHNNRSLEFHTIDNPRMLCYSKSSSGGNDVLLTVVNLDPSNTQSGWVELNLSELHIDGEAQYQVHDLFSDDRYLWEGSRNYVKLDPSVRPAHIFKVREEARTEEDFKYYV